MAWENQERWCLGLFVVVGSGAKACMIQLPFITKEGAPRLPTRLPGGTEEEEGEIRLKSDQQSHIHKMSQSIKYVDSVSSSAWSTKGNGRAVCSRLEKMDVSG